MFLENVAEVHDKNSIHNPPKFLLLPFFPPVCLSREHSRYFLLGLYLLSCLSFSILPPLPIPRFLIPIKCPLSILQVQMILPRDTCFDFSPNSNKHGSEKTFFFFFWLLTFTYPHSSEGLLVLEHRRKIHMAPRGVLNVIPMVGWGTCRLDRLPNSKSFSISLVSE